MENLTHYFREMSHVLQFVEELRIKSKTMINWSSQKKECIFSNALTLGCYLNALSTEKTFRIYILLQFKSITSYTFLACL